MNTPLWNDSQIHAFVDGALDANAAARLEADSRTDIVLAARIARQRELRSLLRGAFDPVLDEPVPQRLRDALAGPGPGATVTPIGAARAATAAHKRIWSKREWGAIAATLVLGVLVGSAFRTPDNNSLQMTQNGLIARGELDSALSTKLSSMTTPAEIRIGLSFRAADGAWCRTFDQHGNSGLACRRAGSWTVQLLEGNHAAPAETAGDYRQAASSLSPAMLGAIKAQGGGDAIDAEQEQQQLRAGWE
jgi:hypothetical protein